MAACIPHFQSLLALFTLHHWQLKLALEAALWVYIAGIGWRKQRERRVSIGVACHLSHQCYQGVHYFCGRMYSVVRGIAVDGCSISSCFPPPLSISEVSSAGKCAEKEGSQPTLLFLSSRLKTNVTSSFLIYRTALQREALLSISGPPCIWRHQHIRE